MKLLELSTQRVDVMLFVRKKAGKFQWSHAKRAGRPIVFQQMSPADVWDLIVTAARERLFQVPRRPVRQRRIEK